MANQDDGWVDLSHELPKSQDDGWQDLSHELPNAKKEEPQSIEDRLADKDQKDLEVTKSALEGLGQIGTFGYLNNIRGAVEPYTFAALNKLTGQNVEPDDYVTARDSYAKQGQKLKEDHPVAYLGGGIAGGLASTAVLPALSAVKGASVGSRILNAAKNGATIGAVSNPGDVEGEVTPLQFGDRVKNAGLGGAIGGGSQAAGEGISAILKNAPAVFKKAAEKLAEKATGATGKQTEGFKENSGRELLDRGLVKFGDNPEKIAERVHGAVNDANSMIDNSLTNLDAKGAHVDVNDVIDDLQKQINEMSKDPSKAGVVRKLNGIVEDITATGEPSISLKDAEQIKRGFRKAAGNWLDPEAGQAGKSAYLSYMDAVENAAQKADPNSAKLFEEGKKTYGLLSPIQEAAEKRAAQLNQSPFGGFGDASAAGAGAVIAGGPGAIVAPFARKLIGPRIASSSAVTSDFVANQLTKMSPKFAEMAEKNPGAFSLLVNRVAMDPKFKSQQKEELPALPHQDPIQLNPLGNQKQDAVDPFKKMIADDLMKRPVMQKIHEQNPEQFKAMVDAIAQSRKYNKEVFKKRSSSLNK